MIFILRKLNTAEGEGVKDLLHSVQAECMSYQSFFPETMKMIQFIFGRNYLFKCKKPKVEALNFSE